MHLPNYSSKPKTFTRKPIHVSIIHIKICNSWFRRSKILLKMKTTLTKPISSKLMRGSSSLRRLKKACTILHVRKKTARKKWRNLQVTIFTVRHATGTILHACLPTYFKPRSLIFPAACLWHSLVKTVIPSLVIWLLSNSKISKRTSWMITRVNLYQMMIESLTFLTISV